MVFVSKLPGIARPRTDVFNYLFTSRRNYPRDRVLYRHDRTGETLTAAELERKSRQFAWSLVHSHNVKRGDVVAILAIDSLLYPISVLGILAAGATVELIPLQKELEAKDCVSRMRQAEAVLLITDETCLPMASQALGELKDIDLLIPSRHLSTFNDESPEYHGFSIDSFEDAESSSAFLNRTSGSTGGAIKTVITTHAHYIAALEGTIHTIPSNTDPDHDVWLSCLSFGFFINTKLNISLNIMLGIPVVIMDGALEPSRLSVVSKHRVTFLFMPPPVAAAIAAIEELAKGIDLSSIKWLLSAGASLNPEVQRKASAILNNVHVDLEWGTSETLLIAIQRDGHASSKASSGVLVNGMEAMVIDGETGAELGPMQNGEIYIRNSAARFAGYKNNDTANASAFDSEGWFHSGDYGHLDQSCNVYIVDRLKELIRVGGGYGVHISAVDLENVILQHAAVAQVIVTACPSRKTGMDMPTAFTILKPEWRDRKNEALASLKVWAAERLTGLHELTGGFLVVSAFPLIGFKIDRRKLRQTLVQMQTESITEKADLIKRPVVAVEEIQVVE